MKKTLRIAPIVLLAALCLGFVAYSYSLGEIQIKLAGDSGNGDVAPLQYHFVLIAQDTGDSFWQSVKEGAGIAGEKYSAAIEFNGPMIQDEDAELDYLNIAIASRVHGIAVYVTDKDKFRPLINRAIDLGIHVVTIESDDKDSKREAFVGPNSYTAGYQEGSLVMEAVDGISNVAIIIGGNYAGNEDAMNSLLNGFNDSILNNPSVTLSTVQLSNTGYFGAETTIRRILNEHPEVNTVVSTGLDDTLEIVRVLIDLNKESNFTVIGYGNTPQIREYIQKNNIFGSVYEDPKETGSQSIKSLVQIINGLMPSSFINTGVYTITRNNLVSFHGS